MNLDLVRSALFFCVGFIVALVASVVVAKKKLNTVRMERNQAWDDKSTAGRELTAAKTTYTTDLEQHTEKIRSLEADLATANEALASEYERGKSDGVKVATEEFKKLPKPVPAKAVKVAAKKQGA